MFASDTTPLRMVTLN